MKKITAFQAYSLGWKFFKKNALQHIGVFLLMGIVMWVISLLLMPATSSMWFKGFNMSPGDITAMQSMTPPYLAMLVLLLIEIFVYLFLYGYTLDIVRNQYEGLGEVFSKYVRDSIFLYVVIYAILFFLAAIAILIPIAGITAALLNNPLYGMVIGYLIILYLAIRLFFAFYFLLDGYDFADAIRLSWQKTRPYVGEILIFIIIPVIIFIVVFIILMMMIFKNSVFFLIAYIIFNITGLIVVPYLMLSQSAFYSRAVSDDAPQPEMPTSLE